MQDDTRGPRVAMLEACGAGPGQIEPLLAYGASPYAALPAAAATLPFPDEPHIEAWQQYAGEAATRGAFEALRRRFVQLQFPVRAGMSEEEPYHRATRRGLFADAAPFAPGVALEDPGGLELEIHPSLAGRIPVVVPATRADFVTLVQAFTERNEPAEVPDSMGACLVNGLNNWSRVEAHRERWRAGLGPGVGEEATDAAWAMEFKALAARKPLYQDRFIILSRGPYSAIPAGALGLDEAAWLQQSLAIRREHECVHYLTYRAAGLIRSNVLDELIADFAGLVAATGTYSAEVARRFLGLHGYPAVQPGSRIWIYRGQPPLDDEAMQVVAALAVRATNHLEGAAADWGAGLRELATLGRLVAALAALTLEELAAGHMPEPAAAPGAPVA
jgi:hypothetical protein